jgi:hypothetical protein
MTSEKVTNSINGIVVFGNVVKVFQSIKKDIHIKSNTSFNWLTVKTESDEWGMERRERQT